MNEAAGKMAEMLSKVPNPANAEATPKAERKRVPMALPQARLSVPDLPGYHLHWMRGTPERIAQAQQAGYEFVTAEEISLINHDLAGDGQVSGNSDMGTRVSTLASISGSADITSDGQPMRMYLMKLRMEHWLDDQAAVQARNDGVAEALSGGLIGVGQKGELAVDQANRYVDNTRTQLPDLFRKKSQPNRRP